MEGMNGMKSQSTDQVAVFIPWTRAPAKHEYRIYPGHSIWLRNGAG